MNLLFLRKISKTKQKGYRNMNASLKQTGALLMALLVLFSLSACGSSQAAAEPPEQTRTVVDALGREVTLPAAVERIVPLGNTPRMITYLGLADKVVGLGGTELDEVTPLTAYAYAKKDLWKDLPLVGTDSMGNTDYYPEEIIAVQPDVILCSYTEDIVRELETKTGVPVVAVSMGTLFADDYDQALLILGEACGVPERAEAVVQFIDDCLADLAARTGSVPEDEKPTVLSAAATYKGVHGIEGVRLQDPVLDAVNARNIAAQDGEASAATVDREQILAWNPDYIFCDYGGGALVKEDAAADPQFYEQLKAFSQGQIYQHPSTTSYFSNLEISLVNCYYIGSVLYPEQFADVELTAKAREIFGYLLGDENYLAELDACGAFYGPIPFEGA